MEIGPHTEPIIVLRPRRDTRRRRQPRPPGHARDRARRTLGRRHDADHGRLRRAAVGDGALHPARSRNGPSTSDCRPTRAVTDAGAFDALLDGGAVGFKIHEDYGADAALIDATLAYADAHDVSVALHTDGLNEIGGARRHGRCDQRANGSRLSRRGHRRRARAGRHRPHARAQHHLLVDDADDPVRQSTRSPSICP